MIFRQLFDPQSSTYTYLLVDSATREAVLIDPVFEQARRDAALVAELGVRLVWTLETHVHADHVTGAWLLRRRLGSRIALGAKTGARGADRLLAHGERVEFGRRHLRVVETPGHTAGCVSYVLDDETMAFTGDALLIRGCGRTDFQSGDARALFRSVRERLFSLPAHCLVYPAHDYRGLSCSSIGEERRFNPRVGDAVFEDDFVGYMTHLGLPHPKKMEVAVPANLRCGEPQEPAALEDEPDWAPLAFTIAGIWEVQPEWLEENLARVEIVDVREPHEFEGPLGHIPGAKLVPLGALEERAKEFVGEKPVVTVCRSGARSAQASVILR
ncbi:MAG: MBL fold metallo-hydrolase, partial [Burkholderiales bacterium]|nr:MBL fold metallo-hydrolase [Burkholderiales bacterium]